MARIKIKDLPKNMKISKADLESIRGGKDTAPFTEGSMGAHMRNLSSLAYLAPKPKKGGGGGCGCGGGPL